MTTLTPELSDISVFLPIDRLNNLLSDETFRAVSIPLVQDNTLKTMFIVYPSDRSRCENVYALSETTV